MNGEHVLIEEKESDDHPTSTTAKIKQIDKGYLIQHDFLFCFVLAKRIFVNIGGGGLEKIQ